MNLLSDFFLKLKKIHYDICQTKLYIYIYIVFCFDFHYILLLKSLFWNSLTKSWAKFPPGVPVRFTVLFHIISSWSLRSNHPWIAEKKQRIWIDDTVIITFLKADSKHYKVFSLEKAGFFPKKSDWAIIKFLHSCKHLFRLHFISLKLI